MKRIFVSALLVFTLVGLQAQNVGIGTNDPKAKLDINGDLILESKELILSEGATYQLDVNTNKFNHYKLTGPTSNFQIAGIAAAEHDRTVALYNRTGVSLEVYNDDVNTLPQDRILTGTGGTFAVYNGGNVVLKYDTLIAKWEIISSHYNSLDNFGSSWAGNANDIYNTNSGNIGIGTSSPTAKLSLNGNLALLSDTIRVTCGLVYSFIIIDNLVKNKSILHFVNEGCGTAYTPPVIAGLSGGADGKIVTLVSHVEGMEIKHLQGLTIMPSSADSLNMIELYEPNNNGSINQPYSYLLNNGGSITLIYDATRNRWKPLSMYGDVKTEIVGWNRGGNPNNIYNPNAGNVGIGTSSPNAKLQVNGTLKIVDGTQGAGKILTSDAMGLASWQPPPPSSPAYYASVGICCQSWMTKNLDVSTYRNGDAIPKVTDASAWSALTTGAYCYYNNDSTTYAATYGKLYNWYAVNDPRGLAPEGWHIPSEFEWTTLSNCLGGYTVAGGPMKEIGTTHWTTPNANATNNSNFSGLPCGRRDSNGFFDLIGEYVVYWSSTEFNSSLASTRELSYFNGGLLNNNTVKKIGLSVRCIRD